MGCDIHLHVEVKLNGRWEHLNHVSVARNYRLFNKMAGVRAKDNETVTPIDKPLGIPDDSTYVTRWDFKKWEGNAHSARWLSSAEVAAMIDSRNEWDYLTNMKEFGATDLFGYLFGGSFDGFVKHEDTRDDGLEDFRFVFWFDN